MVRCSCVQSDPQAGTHIVTDDTLSLYVEFNVSYRLTVTDTAAMPPNEAKVRHGTERCGAGYPVAAAHHYHHGG